MKRIVVGILIMAAISVSLLGCASNTNASETGSGTETGTGAATNLAAKETLDPQRDWEPVTTEYGDLKYPDDFYEFLETEETKDGDNLRVLFRAIINENKYDMFTLIIGEAEGEIVGTLTDSAGTKRNVYVEFHELGDTSALSESESNRLYAMQESLNYVLDNLY